MVVLCGGKDNWAVRFLAGAIGRECGYETKGPLKGKHHLNVCSLFSFFWGSLRFSFPAEHHQVF